MAAITETIKERKSVRSYTGEPLSTELKQDIINYINQLVLPFGTKARIKLISTSIDNQPLKLGTYGVISGAKDFLLLLSEKGLMQEVGAGYMFEQVVLHCTQLGLGTCWLGGTVKRTDFLAQIKAENNEELIVISPVGYKREKKTLVDSIFRAGAGSDKRKPFGALFFKDNFATPLTEAAAGNYETPLQMLRLAPSASNKQPWRVVLQNNIFHFYCSAGHFSTNDVGIALCHFELTCQELGLKGNFETRTNTPSQKGIEYVISWIPQ